MKKMLLSLALSAGIFTGLNAQGLPPVSWQRLFGGTGDEIPFSFAATKDGGYIILGTTTSSAGTGDVSVRKDALKDYWVVKVSASGALEWENTFGGNNTEEEMGQIIQTADGGYVFAGCTYSKDIDPNAGGGNRSLWVVRLQSNGTILWDQPFGSSDEDYSRAIIPTADNGFLIGGAVAVPSQGGGGGIGGGLADKRTRPLTVKIDNIGNELWWKQHEDLTDSTAEIVRLLPMADGSYGFAGRSNRGAGLSTMNPNQKGDFMVGKLDQNGNKLWSKVLGGSRFDYLSSAFETSDGGIVVSGYTNSEDLDLAGVKKTASNVGDLWIVKYDGAGNMVWSKSYGGDGSDSMAYMARTLDGGCLVAACTKSTASGDMTGTNNGKTDIWILKLNANGDLEWEDNFGGSEDDIVRGIIANDDGSFAILGTSSSSDKDLAGVSSQGGMDYWIVKFEAPAIDSIVVRVKDNLPATITTAVGTLQLEAVVYPTMISQQVTWSVSSGTGTATVDANGLVTAGDNGTVWVKAEWVQDNTYSDSIQITINVEEDEEEEDPTFIATFNSKDNIKIYPNPAKGSLNLHAAAAHTAMQLAIVDLTGRTVYTDAISENGLLQPYAVDLTSVPAGIYLLELRDANSTITHRISVY